MVREDVTEFPRNPLGFPDSGSKLGKAGGAFAEAKGTLLHYMIDLLLQKNPFSLNKKTYWNLTYKNSLQQKHR